MAYNVVLKTNISARDLGIDKRSAVYMASDLENGCVVKLTDLSTVDDEKDVWISTNPAATDLGLYMVMSPEKPITQDGMGEMHIVTCDPRAFTNIKGKVMDVVFLRPNVEIEMTGEGITGIATEANKYLNVGAGTKLVAAATAGAGLSLRRIGKGELKIANGKPFKDLIPTYRYIVEKN